MSRRSATTTGGCQAHTSRSRMATPQVGSGRKRRRTGGRAAAGEGAGCGAGGAGAGMSDTGGGDADGGGPSAGDRSGADPGGADPGGADPGGDGDAVRGAQGRAAYAARTGSANITDRRAALRPTGVCTSAAPGTPTADSTAPIRTGRACTNTATTRLATMVR